MPIYMDLHIVPGVIAEHVAQAHQEDLKIQGNYGCRVMTYWVDEAHGSAFCLLEAPDKESVIEMHNDAHGLIPHEIIEVNSGIVQAFLGRIKYPENHSVSVDTGLKIFNDPAFRIILVITTIKAKLLEHDLGTAKAREVLYEFTKNVKQQIAKHEGRLVEMEGEGFVVSFISASQGINCALGIQNEVAGLSEEIGLGMSLNAGLPVDKSDRLFGTTIKFARHLCTIADSNQIVLASIVDELNKSDRQNDQRLERVKSMTIGEEKFLELMMQVLEKNWQDAELTVEDCCHKLGLSKSQLYRKCVALFKMSPNNLIREYRLVKSLHMLDARCNVSETTFETGFSSPSYFTKCFQKRFGLAPLQYLKM
ncbi:nickel-binding protein [Maribacter sp. 2210JD10-5]|uniref:nickel-binding protein n=1 Tax=Maribacter sp. 2210JD10-5 TaxID=3386272 RepID=UPI0039BCEBFA